MISNQIEKRKKRIKVGVIGCGLIAQTQHLPNLRTLQEEGSYKIEAICDISLKLLAKIGELYDIKKRYTDYRDLIKKADIDAVMILTPINHSEITIEAAREGKNIFVEKPMCVSLKEADKMIEETENNRVKLMVGHTRIYDPGFEYAKKLAREINDVFLIRWYSSRGPIPLVPSSNPYPLYRFDDVSQQARRKDQEFVEEKKKELGSMSETVKSVYMKLIGAAIHDAYNLRDMFGSPGKVLFTNTWGDDCLHSVLDYGDIRCTYTRGIFSERGVKNFADVGFIVYGTKRIVDFKFSYFKHVPSSLVVKEVEDDVLVEKKIEVSRENAYRRELIHFHNCIMQDTEPISNGREAKEDLRLLLNIAEALR
jgi:predicted dehydrogenase